MVDMALVCKDDHFLKTVKQNTGFVPSWVLETFFEYAWVVVCQCLFKGLSLASGFPWPFGFFSAGESYVLRLPLALRTSG